MGGDGYNLFFLFQLCPRLTLEFTGRYQQMPKVAILIDFTKLERVFTFRR
jgi:hypothetical protein